MITQDAYPPHPEQDQSPYYTELYRSSMVRAPKRQLYALPRTLTELTGPAFGHNALGEGENDLWEMAPGRRAQGSPINLHGRILDGSGRPIANTLVEIWQANAGGRYTHAQDTRDVPRDPNFNGYGRAVTDSQGRYFFRTIIPGAYPVPNTGNWWRPPHIHFSLYGNSFMQRLITQMYFPGDPLNELDRILCSIPSPKARDRLVARRAPEAGELEYILGYEFDIVLRGRDETPMVD